MFQHHLVINKFYCIYKMAFYSTIKRNILTQAATKMDLKDVLSAMENK